MPNHHGYSLEEAAQVCFFSPSELEEKLKGMDVGSLSPRERAAVRDTRSNGGIKVLPYPGGRHPRIGFLEGAIDPQRGTKASLFPPWENGGYVVLDLPEAIFSNLGLIFLAHTHVPTIWNASGTVIENVDWTVNEDGSMSSDRSLPNGIRFGASVVPKGSGADLELWLQNGTEENLTGLRTQICAMPKGAPGFEDQTEERRVFQPPVVAKKSSTGNRWILVAFDRCHRTWGNPPCPCIHSDPILPDAAPGETVRVKGRLWFYEGEGLEEEIARASQEFSVLK